MIKQNYSSSILAVSNSILLHYGATPHHATLPVLDDLLSKNYKNVVLLVMDGMGVNVLEKNLPINAFLRKHIKMQISSVYPCTTTAALTSILSGKTPIEHAWLGWSCYFKEVDKCIDLFSGHESGTEMPAHGENQANKYLGYENILLQIQSASSDVKTCAVSPFTEYFANTIEGICEHIKNLGNEDGCKFIYAYHYQPDYDIHYYGVSSPSINAMMAEYNNQLERLADALSDTLFLITADHGMTDITMKCIEDFPQVNEMLKRHICLEPRCCSFYIKDDYKIEFAKRFRETFAEKFLLYTHDEFIKSGLLGKGSLHSRTDEFVGDFVAVAVSDIALWYKAYNWESNDFYGAHAGLTEDEMLVPLIVIEKN